MVRGSDLKSGDPEFRSRSDHKLDLFQVVVGSPPLAAVLENNQLVGLLPVGILNLLS